MTDVRTKPTDDGPTTRYPTTDRRRTRTTGSTGQDVRTPVRDKVAVRKDGAVTPATQPAESSDTSPDEPADAHRRHEPASAHWHEADDDSRVESSTRDSTKDDAGSVGTTEPTGITASAEHTGAHENEHQYQHGHDGRTSTHRTVTTFRTFADPAPRLIATDLDGTLLRGDRTLSSRTIAALAAAEEAGVEVFFVTGRPARWMSVVADHLAGHGMAILSNGAAVYDLRAGTLIEAFPLPDDDALAAAHALSEAVPGTTYAVERVSRFRREPDYPAFEADHAEPRATIEGLLAEDRDLSLLKLLASHPTADPDDFLAAALAVAGTHGEITRSSESALLEVSRPGVTKATTLAKCCAERGVTAAEVVAFGDMPNDLAMLQWAGTSYAVANAHPHVLAATTHRTESNDEDGVARVIERLVAARRASDRPA